MKKMEMTGGGISLLSQLQYIVKLHAAALTEDQKEIMADAIEGIDTSVAKIKMFLEGVEMIEAKYAKPTEAVNFKAYKQYISRLA